ncbi:uncharacterized protein [Dysidea avara]|uniref:uncharacterized protein n=1 Tax=Dysidea avara TaxID=196820 RepID=UPI00332221E7
MVQLKANGRGNVLYNLAKGIGTLREDGQESRFPIKRMPMGLIEYSADFFAADNLQSISCPLDYRLWQQTMYSNFGQKWSILHHGPMCRVNSSPQASDIQSDDTRRQCTMNALVNIPAVSERSLRRDFGSSAITITAEIQVAVLDDAAISHPNSWWWLKADGCDINKGLKESVQQKWSGDVDLNDGHLQKQYEAYQKRLDSAKKLGLEDRNKIKDQLQMLLNDLTKDIEFLNSELTNVNNEYSEKLQSRQHKEKEMIKLTWKVKELSDLNENGREIFSQVNLIISKLPTEECDRSVNIPRDLHEIRQKVCTFIKGVVRHQRIAATHLLVFMISNEERHKKPYALPVQCLPYKGLSDAKVRELANEIIHEMVRRGMKVAGFTTDGEWNSLRSKGNTRPLTILQVRSEARAKYSHIKLARLAGMLTPVCDSDGNVTGKVPNLAVSNILLMEILSWKKEGATDQDVFIRLRERTVPPAYRDTVHNWIDGKDETPVEQLRSILAQLEYTYQINAWQAKGVPFKDYVYVPEIHPKAGMEFCEREDDGHILKRIGQSLRQGGPRNLQLERFEEVLHDSKAGLTYTALSGNSHIK